MCSIWSLWKMRATKNTKEIRPWKSWVALSQVRHVATLFGLFWYQKIWKPSGLTTFTRCARTRTDFEILMRFTSGQASQNMYACFFWKSTCCTHMAVNSRERGDFARQLNVAQREEVCSDWKCKSEMKDTTYTANTICVRNFSEFFAWSASKSCIKCCAAAVQFELDAYMININTMIPTVHNLSNAYVFVYVQFSQIWLNTYVVLRSNVCSCWKGLKNSSRSSQPCRWTQKPSSSRGMQQWYVGHVYMSVCGY